MVDVLQLLETAEQTWRQTIQIEYPLFADMPVIKAKPDPKNSRHWMFYTDLKTIHMDVFKPEVVEKNLRDTIQHMYQGAYGVSIVPSDELMQRLLHDHFTYLYFHELFHPAYCPDSKEDEKLVDKALYDGIQAALPNAPKPDILKRVGNARNAGWDQVIDTGFSHLSRAGSTLESRLERVLEQAPVDLQQIRRLPDGVIPIFDIIEFEESKKPFDSFFYPLTRAIYGLTFTRDHALRGVVFDYFKKRTTQQMRPAEFDEVIKQAIKGFVAELSPEQLQFSRIYPQEFSRHVDEFYAHYNDSQGDILHEGLMVDIASLLLDKKSRYDALRGFIEPLAKYISLSKEEKRHGTHIGEGEGSGDQQTGPNQPGGNTEQALMNLADLLNPDERNELLSQVANNPGGSQAGNAQKDKRLSKLASDEYYKRNVPEINIRSPNYEAVTIDLGKKRVPFLVSSERILTQDVPNLPLEKILEFQEQTGLAQLFQISDFEFQFDHYEWQEVQDVDYSFENTGLDLPANIIFHVDSSGSMGSRNYVSTGCKYDVLMHVCYGMLKTLRKASKEMNTPVQVISANFSNGTILSKPVELSHMYDTPNNEAKDVLTGFQAGGTEYTPAAFKDNL